MRCVTRMRTHIYGCTQRQMRMNTDCRYAHTLADTHTVIKAAYHVNPILDTEKRALSSMTQVSDTYRSFNNHCKQLASAYRVYPVSPH